MDLLSDGEILKLIQSSVVFTSAQKTLLESILPKLNEDQKKQVIEFVQKEKNEMDSLEKKYTEEKASLYQQYTEELDAAVRQAQKMVLTESENASNEQEGSPEDILKSL